MKVVMNKALKWLGWLSHQPIALINICGLIVILGIFIHLMVQEIDILKNWTIETTSKKVRDGMPVYHPGGTLEFTSTSIKTVSADGDVTRRFNCDAIPGIAVARDITISPVPANRSPGYTPPTENSIVVPSTIEFNGLPRICRIIFETCYTDVVLWRDHCEHARSNDFIVEEAELDPETIRKEIDALNERLKEVERLSKETGQVNASAPVSTPKEPSVASEPEPQQKPAEIVAQEPAEEQTGLLRGLIRGIFP